MAIRSQTPHIVHQLFLASTIGLVLSFNPAFAGERYPGYSSDEPIGDSRYLNTDEMLHEEHVDVRHTRNSGSTSGASSAEDSQEEHETKAFTQINSDFLHTIREDIMARSGQLIFSARLYTPLEPYRDGTVGDENYFTPVQQHLGFHFSAYLPPHISSNEDTTGLDTLNSNGIALFRNYEKTTLAFSQFWNTSDEGNTLFNEGHTVMQSYQSMYIIPLYDLEGALEASWTMDGKDASTSVEAGGDTLYAESSVHFPAGYSVDQLYYQVSEPIEGAISGSDHVYQDIFYRLRTNGSGKHGSLYGILVITAQ